MHPVIPVETTLRETLVDGVQVDDEEVVHLVHQGLLLLEKKCSSRSTRTYRPGLRRWESRLATALSRRRSSGSLSSFER